VHVWTVNDAAAMVRLLDMGIDGLITDRPTLARELLRARGQWREPPAPSPR
jgi:glycerophosphoryl diester phosphodiesterase